MALKLSRMLLAPVAALLGKKRLLIVADGALQYVPFAALPAPAAGDGEPGPGVRDKASQPLPPPPQFLIVEHEIVSLPSASTLAVLRREAGEHKAATKTLAVLADPVFERTDERFKAGVRRPAVNTNTPAVLADESRGLGLMLAKSAQESGAAAAGLEIPRLRATRREADAINALAPPAARLEALDFAANRAAATDPALADYRFVHFATHGFLDSQHPELSGILLSMFDEQGRAQDGFLRAHEVFNLKLNADVVVLSACQTGLGKEVKGEGLVGLTRGFMFAGAPRVVVSLWSVNDAATAELMTRFYRGMLVSKLRPAQALQAAQVSMLNDKRFAAPFYWAAFTLQGEWR
jgi:CHAT domain-containing protein